MLTSLAQVPNLLDFDRYKAIENNKSSCKIEVINLTVANRIADTFLPRTVSTMLSSETSRTGIVSSGAKANEERVKKGQNKSKKCEQSRSRWSQGMHFRKYTDEINKSESGRTPSRKEQQTHTLPKDDDDDEWSIIKLH